ncbi:MAG: CHAP domain-containing protein [bacterium]|nr:CHAP domain-containing protein [bacterium]
MQKTFNSQISIKRRLVLLSSVLMIAVSTLAGVRYVEAQSLQDQINDLTRKNNQTEDQVEDLKLEAASYQDAINQLQARINAYQLEINKREAQSKKIQKQIAEKEAELKKQKLLLGKNIKAMYLEGDITTIEMLATSKSLTEYFDKQQYRSVVKDKIKDTLDKVTVLKAELQTKKAEVEKIIKQQEQLRTATNIQRGEQARLLNMNKSQQAAFSSQMKSNQKKINELKRQQAIENARLFGGNGGQLGGGGYPWGYARCIHDNSLEGWCYNYDWGVNGNPWNWSTGGYGYRNCTDWVAYRVRVAGGNVPGGLGNAKLWDDRAPGYGFTVSSTPRVGAGAVSNNGYYGHVMYVEAVNGDGSIVVSDYNRAGTGKYDMNVLSAGTASNLRYVYF